MADINADAGIFACCCICITTALQTWCNLHAFGANVRCCGGQQGCCGCCCDSSFNEDDFDERMKKERARKERDNNEPVDSQPAPTQGMSVPMTAY
ncbi:hypothetical protein BDN67DRAFT_965251, partial [Paxillus ammoniavirescens]